MSIIATPSLSITPVTPPVGGEPTYSAATDDLIDSESFDGFDTIATGGNEFRDKYPIGRIISPSTGSVGVVPAVESNGIVTLVTGRGGTGKALRLKYAGATGASDIIVGTEGVTGQGALGGGLPEVGAPWTHFLFSTWVRFSAGADPGTQTGGVKGLMFWYGVSRYQFQVHRTRDWSGEWYQGADRTRWNIGIHPPNYLGPSSPWDNELGHWQINGEAPKFSQYNDGAWHRFTIEEYDISDGRHHGIRFWMDGTLVCDQLDNVGNPPDWGGNYAYNHPITHWMVFGNFVNSEQAAAATTFTVDFDDWIAWTN